MSQLKHKIPKGRAATRDCKACEPLQKLLALSPHEAETWVDDNVRGHTETVELLKMLVKQVIALSADR